MSENKLINSFYDTIKDPLLDSLEIGVDSLIDNEFVKDLPIIKYVAATYNIFDDIKGRHNINKLAKFLKELHNNTLTTEQIESYKRKLNDTKFLNNQLEYSLIILDRYLDFDKVKILGRLFYFLIDGKISWIEYKKYSEILDRLLPTDLEEFVNGYGNYVYELYNDSILRFVSLGLLVETTNRSPFIDDQRGGYAITSVSLKKISEKNKIYELTQFGKKLIEILLDMNFRIDI